MLSVSTLATQVVRKNAANSFVSYKRIAQQLYEIGNRLDHFGFTQLLLITSCDFRLKNWKQIQKEQSLLYETSVGLP